MTSLERAWTVRIGTHPGDIHLVQVGDPDPVWRAATQLVGCEYIEGVHALGLALTGCLLLVDDHGRISKKPVNPYASWLYGRDLHGNPIYGTAVVAKNVMTVDGPDWVWLTHSEASDLGVLMLSDVRGGVSS